MFISEVMTTAPQDERGALETKTYQELERLNIKYERVDNDTVEAMEECVEISEKLGAEIRKTIVVCNRQKTQFFLVILPANKRFDSKLFAAMMRTARVSFASPEDMQNVIGLTPGEASVMGILNDPEGKVLEWEVSGDHIQAVHMLPGYTHNIINLSDTEDLVTVMYCNEIFDPGRPDTFFVPVK